MLSSIVKNETLLDLTTFYIGDVCCAVDITSVREINRLLETTHVPLAPDYVKGILNLRGEIITVIDIAKRLKIPSKSSTTSRKNIIVHYHKESIGMMVDSIGDVIRTRDENIEKLPSNVSGDQAAYYQGVLKTDKQLISILNLNELLGG
jgi:purine-binding chemotaxis protein CheW